MADKKGALLQRLINARNDLRAAEEVAKKKKEVYDNLAQKMIDQLTEDGTTMTGDKSVATASIVDTVVAQVTDWDKFYRYVSKNKAFYLLQRRVADKAWREEVDDQRKGRLIPGTEKFVKRRLNLRVANS